MHKAMSDRIRIWIRTIGTMAAGAAIYALIAQLQPLAWGDIRKSQPDGVVRRSGAERSLDTLKEISQTLRKIDQRMERWERVAQK